MKENEIKTAGVILHNSAPEELAQACAQWQEAEKESRGTLTVIIKRHPDGKAEAACSMHGKGDLLCQGLTEILREDRELTRLILCVLSEVLADTMTHQSNK